MTIRSGASAASQMYPTFEKHCQTTSEEASGAYLAGADLNPG